MQPPLPSRRFSPRPPSVPSPRAPRRPIPASSPTRADPCNAPPGPAPEPVVLRAHLPAPCSGSELRQLRLSRGLIQRELAGRLGYSVQTISSWEIGRRTIPASITARLYEVLDDVTADRRAARARFLGALHAAWAG